MNPRTALAWSFAERYASFAITFASTVVLARLLTPAQVGVFSLSMALLAVLGIVRDFGVSEYLIQERELTPARVATAFGVALAVGWPLALAVYCSRDLVAGFFNEPLVADVLAVLSLQMALVPITSPVFALLNRELDFRRVFVLQLACNVTQSTATLVLAWMGFGSLALAWGPVVNVGVQTVLLLTWRTTRRRFVAPSLRNWRDVTTFGVPYAGSRGLETLSRNVHEPVIARSFDFASVGLFSRAWGMVEMFHGNVADAVVRVATPAFAQAHRDGKPVSDALSRATGLYVSISWPFFAFVAVMAEPIIGVLFGPQWLAAAPLAAVLALAALPAALYELVPQLLSATGQVRQRLRISAWVAPVHIGGVLLAAPHGLMAVAAVFFVSSVWALWLNSRATMNSYGVGVRALWPAVATGAVMALVVAATAGAARWSMVQLQVGGFYALAVVLACAALAWWLAARQLKIAAHAELVRAISSRLSAWRRQHTNPP